MGHPRFSVSFIFGLFQPNNTNFKQNNVKKCPSSIQCWDSNSWPPEYESTPLTTRPVPIFGKDPVIGQL